MKKTVILFALLFTAFSVVNLAAEVFPKNTLAELATGTWCGYCPDAYDGLDIVQEHYNTGEFTQVRYYTYNNGNYGTPETDAWLSWMGVSSYPDCFFNGSVEYGGGGDIVATGDPFMEVLRQLNVQVSPIKITTGSFTADGDSYSFSADILIGEDLDNTNLMVKAVVFEDELTAEYTNVVRDVMEDQTLTVSQGGESQTVNFTFTKETEWDAENLAAVVYVQNTQTKDIIQSDNNYPDLDYAHRVCAENLTFFGEVNDLFNTEDYYVFNTGTEDDSYIFNAIGDLPGDSWSTGFCDDSGCYPSPSTFSIGAGENLHFHVSFYPASEGQGFTNMSVSSEQSSIDKVLGYSIITSGVNVLFIDDDGGSAYNESFEEAFEGNNIIFAEVPRGIFPIGQDFTDNFDYLVWNCGWAFPSVDVDDRALLENLLDAGMPLFIAGQDIGWDLCEGTDNPDVQFYNNYLHADYVADDINTNVLQGVAGDPIGDGLVVGIENVYGGDSFYPSDIDPYDDNATVFLEYTSAGSGQFGALRADDGTHKVVYLAFGFEAITEASVRQELLGNAMEWMGYDMSIENSLELALSKETVLQQNYPNPFNPETIIGYSLNPQATDAELTVYNVMGQLVKTWPFSELSGNSSVVWNGQNQQGEGVGSGIYFYRLSENGEVKETRKMILLK